MQLLGKKIPVHLLKQQQNQSTDMVNVFLKVLFERWENEETDRHTNTPVLPQWHVKDPGDSAKSAGGRLHLNTHTPWTQPSRSGLTMPLSRHSVGTYPETKSHATSQGTFGHSRLNSLNTVD